MQDTNDLLEVVTQFGEVLNFITIKQYTYVQFLTFESILTFWFFLPEQKESLKNLKVNVLFFTKEQENQTEVKDAYVKLDKLPADMLGDKLLEAPFIHKQYLKALYLRESESQALLQFHNIQSATKFLKLNEYKDMCVASLEK